VHEISHSWATYTQTHTRTDTHPTTCRHTRMQLTVPKWTGSGTGRTLGYLHTHTPHHMQACKDATHSAQVDRVRYRPYIGLPTHTHTHPTTCRHARMQLTVPKWTGSGTGRTLGYLHTHTHTHTPPHAGTQGCNSQCPSGQGQVQAVHHAHDEYVCDVPAVGCL